MVFCEFLQPDQKDCGPTCLRMLAKHYGRSISLQKLRQLSETTLKILDAAYGKINLGQKVRMKFNNYPYQQFGQLVGNVSKISKVPAEEGYFVKVKLEKGLTTTYNQQIDYKPEMSGVAEVVTEDLRLIERIFNNFRKVFDR